MRSVIGAFLFFPFLVVSAAAAASGDQGPLHLTASNRRPTPVAGAAPSIRVDVNLTLVPVTVLDPDGRNVTGLERENFDIYDGKQPRPIASFSRADQPVTIGLVYDCSRSMLDKFVMAREAPVQLFKQLDDQDESFLVTVSDEPSLRTPLTSHFEELRNALLFTHPQGSTALLDGVHLGLAEMKKAHDPRHALIVVSDGGDNNSRYTLREMKNIAMESDTQIFSIGLHAAPATQEEALGPELLEDLAKASGGIHYTIQDVSEMADAMAKIGAALHNQYVLGYYPPPEAQDGKYRRITVRLKIPSGLPPLRIFARAGYYAPER